jgi:RNA binding exosome subunit
MNYAHNVIVTVFAKEQESPEKILAGLRTLFPFNLADEKLKIRQQTTTGLQDNKITIYTVELIKARHTNQFIQYLHEKLNKQQKETLIAQKESRLDEELIFYMRLDKDELINGKYALTDSGNCYHIRIHLAAFPAKREPALEIIEKIFKPKLLRTICE